MQKRKPRTHLQKILKAIENLYSEVYRTADRLENIEKAQANLQTTLTEILTIYKDIQSLEKRIFKD